MSGRGGGAIAGDQRSSGEPAHRNQCLVQRVLSGITAIGRSEREGTANAGPVVVEDVLDVQVVTVWFAFEDRKAEIRALLGGQLFELVREK